ncbi:N-acetylneuraminate synthase family protein [Pontimonas sp.]|nr:N-acetylneuraminate synthase family protein [Pontimonas sp.]
MVSVDWIAEVSSNHNGDFDRSLKLIDGVAAAGFTSVKFQLFEIEKLFSPEALAAKPSLLDRKKWELDRGMVPALSEAARERGLLFGLTPFYLDVVAELVPFVDFFKIASYEMLWSDLLEEVAQAGKPIVLSTGMATMPEVLKSVSTLKDAGASEITVLHCVSAYPADSMQCNLRAIESLRAQTGANAGWSDHTNDPSIVRRAVLRWGATSVELHVDLDAKGFEFGEGHCWLIPEAAALIGEVTEGVLWDGDGVKIPTPSESSERDWRADPIDGLRPVSAFRKLL